MLNKISLKSSKPVHTIDMYKWDGKTLMRSVAEIYSCDVKACPDTGAIFIFIHKLLTL